MLVSLLATLFLPNVSQAEKTLKAIVPWDGEGRLFRIGLDTMLFQGALEGIMYVETSEGKLNEGFVMCPATQKLDLKTRATSGSGNCMITVSGGDTVFATWTCAGQLGSCKGDLQLTGGSGQFEGITGSSKLIIRSPLSVLASDMASGSTIRVASGIAILPELKYQLQAKE
jgi:hypothetical protein